jgi:Leucine-rich repeat (LRR) protein
MHAESIIKAGPKLKTLYINHNLINVIPSSLVNLKFLSEFSHDWNLAFGKPKE